MKQPSKILVPIDFSESSAKALKEAMEIAEGGSTEVILLHVINEEIIQCADAYCLDEATINSIKAQSKEKALKHLVDLSQKLNASHNVKVLPMVRVGVPYVEIIEEQKKSGVDLIIMSHLRTGVSKFILGSVTEKVLKGADCPVLLIR